MPSPKINNPQGHQLFTFVLQQRKEEEFAEFRKRLDNFQLTDAITQSGLGSPIE